MTLKTRLNLSCGIFLLVILTVLLLVQQSGLAKRLTADDATFYVATNGNDNNPGTKQKPFATLFRARDAVRQLKKTANRPIKVLVRAGTHYLDKPLVFGPADSGTAEAPITYAAYPGELVTISGGRKLDCKWVSSSVKWSKGVSPMMCRLPAVKEGDLNFTQLFVNGKRQYLARYPNYDNSEPGKSGYIWPEDRIPRSVKDPNPDQNEDMTHNNVSPRGIIFDPETFTKKRWARPEEATIHIFQAHHWGNLQWTVKAIDYENHYIWFDKGGHQIGAKWTSRPINVNDSSQFYIENVFEELDTPGEWYLDKDKGILYYMPPEGIDLETALVEAPVLQRLIQFIADQYDPVRYITIEGFRITHTASTFHLVATGQSIAAAPFSWKVPETAQ
jgi:hypothetical protein